MPTRGSPHSESSARKSHGEPTEVMRIRLLGDFEVSVGPRTLGDASWRLRKAAGLVKLLALAEAHRLHREQAMDLLWPDSPTKTASNNLRGALHAARRALGTQGSEYVASEDGTLLLCPRSDLWVDTEAFKEAASAARRSRNPAAYRLAIDLYTGELLPGDRFEDWAEEERADLRRMYLELLTELAGLYREQREYDRAVEALRGVVAEEPAEEGAHASLMRLYALSGRQGEALAQYERLGEVLAARLDARPAAETRRLRKDIADGTLLQDSTAVGSPGSKAGAVDHNLPVFTTSFVDREGEMLEIKRELAMTRLLTLTGPGGSGKTRLALEVAHDLVGAYPDGTWLVELAPLSEPGLVVREMAGVLDVQERSGEPFPDTLADALRSRRTLIVLDNCEHLLGGVAPLVNGLLRTCPELRLLATSREALGVPDEIDRPVPPLSMPDPGMTIEELGGYGAARLFVDRALYRPASFALTPENARAVAEVCRQLEGVPLAIELAAARVGVLAVEQISERLSASLKVLTGGGRTLTSRQRTLRGSLDWSHALLDEPEQRLFARLSVFAGGWTTEAAEAVCSGEGVDRDDVPDLLGDLVGKSLVVARTNENGYIRYRVLEIIRQYAAEKLVENGEVEKTHGRHAAFFLALAEEAGPDLEGPRQGPWAERLESEHDNLRTALSWVLDREEGVLGLRFGRALWRFWHNRGYLGEGVGWMGRVLAGRGPAAERVGVMEGMGWLTQKQGDVERARTTYEEMLKLSRELGDDGNTATALNSLGTLAASTGDNAQARRYLEENLAVLERMEEQGYQATLKRYHVSNLLGLLALNEDGDATRASALWNESLVLARETGDAMRIGTSLSSLGYAAVLQGDYERATALCEEALAYANEHVDASDHILPETLINLGLASLGLADHGRAISSFERALAISRPAGRKSNLINALEGSASLASARGYAAEAARLWGAAEAGRGATGIALPPGDWTLHEPHLSSARSLLGEEAWEEALSQGHALSLEEAAGYALEKGVDRAEVAGGEPWSHDEPLGKLSRREQEVVALVARGLTNHQISAELSISERTAGNHVARILHKLNFRSRTQIATWVTDQGLLGPEQN